MKCTLKEFNEYRQWIRKLKLNELHRERRQDEKQIEEARKERLERIALERDPELQEILKRRCVRDVCWGKGRGKGVGDVFWGRSVHA